MLDDGGQSQGVHSVPWGGAKDEGVTFATGPYLSQIDFDNSMPIRKMLFVK